MELIERTTLHNQEGTSDKIYEVDLCRLGSDRYVVNFRYGRRGSNLKEGTKTTEPVSWVKARQIFEKLVESKRRKGYRDVGESAAARPSRSDSDAASATEPTPPIATSSDPRHQAILNRLASRDARNWPLDRVIWRAGVLQISEATPLLVELLGTGEPLRDYCIAWALGWCGGDRALSALNRLLETQPTPDFVRRIAWEARLKLVSEDERNAMRSRALAALPVELREPATNGTTEKFAIALDRYLDGTDYRQFAVIDTLYQIDNQWVRPALLDWLREAPLRPNFFQRLRHLFKMAEYRRDTEVFAILVYAFDRQPGTFKNHQRWEYDRARRRCIPTKERWFDRELKSEQPRRAYSEQTREYLRRRVWRTLNQLGSGGAEIYINLAKEILLQYADSDGAAPIERTTQRWDRKQSRIQTEMRCWDRFARYTIFNHILYENSPRYISHPQIWRCRDGYRPGDRWADTREEAFPTLWDRQPNALLDLLLESNCAPVHEFAVKAIQVHPNYGSQLPDEILIRLLARPYELTVEMAFNWARDRLDDARVNPDLVLAIANCVSSNVRNAAYQLIERRREYFLGFSQVLVGLITSPQSDTRNFVRRLLSRSLFDEEIAQAIVGQIIATLLEFTPSEEANEARTALVQEIGEMLLLNFAAQLRTLNLGVVLDLVRHPLAEVQVIGARVLLNHQTQAVDWPSDVIESLLASPHDSVRRVGVRVFGQLPDETLMGDRVLVMAMAVNRVADIRQAIRPVIRRLAANYPEFGIELALDLADLLTTPERHEGVHRDLVALLREDISGWIARVEKERVLELVKARSPHAQELGGAILQENCDRFSGEFTTSEIVKFASHEIVAIREAARSLLARNWEAIRSNSEAMLAAVRFLEAKWDDSREFAWEMFGNLEAEYWTPEAMISVCDSTQEDTRRFGRDLVTRYFQADYGHEYLLKFSEHPAADMQMFATNYLETYASDNPDRLAKLVPYFVTVLSRVNRGKIAKQRIFKFLDAEAQKSEQAALTVAEILTRQSVTVAIGDKAAAIQTMVKIRKQYPAIALPLQLKPVTETRP